MSEIININVKQLFPHPENPRKDLGDLTELVESIKVNGILQNLTVVPWVGQEDKYTVIIGHRRLAAAKQAGVTEVPCSVVELSQAEQIAVMLTENMQRSDLTVYEQAKAFQQLSLDFGMSVAEIAERSGFSETTVRKRVKLAELDEKKFKKACERGATLFDFAELEKIEDPVAKDECLGAIGTNNFKNVLKNALDEQKYQKRREGWIQQLQKFATQIEQRDYLDGEALPMSWEKSLDRWDRFDEIEVPDDANEIRYFFIVSDTGIKLLKEQVDEPEDEETRRKRLFSEAQEEKYQQLSEISRRHYGLRREFVVNFGAAKTHADKIVQAACKALLFGGVLSYRLDEQEFAKMAGLKCNAETGKVDKNLFREHCAQYPEKTMLLLTFWKRDEATNSYIRRDWCAAGQFWRTLFKDNQLLDDVYYLLESLGYQTSDEELQMRRGTHPLFDEVPDDDD